MQSCTAVGLVSKHAIVYGCRAVRNAVVYSFAVRHVVVYSRAVRHAVVFSCKA